jgi:SAM-dependent methyltransferase
MAVLEERAARFVREAFLIVLGRAAGAGELRDAVRGLPTRGRDVLLMQLLSSPEFHEIQGVRRRGGATREAERDLRALGRDEDFVRCVYECLLGREPDAGGLRHYTSALAAGERRTSIVRSIALSEEFERRLRELAPQTGVLPRDVQLCELANPAKWSNPEWLDVLRSLGLSDAPMAMHRKPYEFAQLIFGCRRLGAIHAEAQVLSVGAGHEHVVYWLANHVRRVVATDMYGGVWEEAAAREGDPEVLARPEDYAPFPFRRSHLTFMRMDGRRLAFRDGTFDACYSLSSIEHFGGFAGASAALAEMQRVLKPGGVLALATEYVLEGPPHEETFQPEELARLIARPGLRLVEPIDEHVYRRYEYAAVDLHRNPYQAPHMVVRFGETVFTTVMVFLRKL